MQTLLLQLNNANKSPAYVKGFELVQQWMFLSSEGKKRKRETGQVDLTDAEIGRLGAPVFEIIIVNMNVNTLYEVNVLKALGPLTSAIVNKLEQGITATPLWKNMVTACFPYADVLPKDLRTRDFQYEQRAWYLHWRRLWFIVENFNVSLKQDNMNATKIPSTIIAAPQIKTPEDLKSVLFEYTADLLGTVQDGDGKEEMSDKTASIAEFAALSYLGVGANALFRNAAAALKAFYTTEVSLKVSDTDIFYIKEYDMTQRLMAQRIVYVLTDQLGMSVEAWNKDVAAFKELLQVGNFYSPTFMGYQLFANKEEQREWKKYSEKTVAQRWEERQVPSFSMRFYFNMNIRWDRTNLRTFERMRKRMVKTKDEAYTKFIESIDPQPQTN